MDKKVNEQTIQAAIKARQEAEARHAKLVADLEARLKAQGKK